MTDRWRPTLGGEDGRPLYARLIDALERDIAAGRLGPGARLPPQRDLAHRLRLSLGTVTKAYAEAERRGLLSGQVGRGSFVSGIGRPPLPTGGQAGIIDLGLNLPPPGPAAARLRETMARLRARDDLIAHLDYAPHAGFEAHRRAGARWLARIGYVEARWQDLAITSGAQHAMALAFAAICAPGDAILTESATFHGMKSLANHAGYKLHGLAMDGEGILPEALERALARRAGRPRVLYTTPTLQNPTARIMGPARRAEIVRLARRHQLWIVEDDIYAARLDSAPPPLADLAPELTFHVTGASKVFAPGLRVGFLVAPPGQLERVLGAMRATCWTAAAFGPLVVTQWIDDGTAEEILAATRLEGQQRFALARRRLRAYLPRQQPTSLHLWLDLSELAAERVAGRALRHSVAVTPPAAPIVDGRLISGLRICLGGPPDQATLDRGLAVLAEALAAAPEEQRGVV